MQAICSKADALGMRLIGEGVENHVQLDVPRKAGCHEVQGSLYSEPVPASALKAMLNRGRSWAALLGLKT